MNQSFVHSNPNIASLPLVIVNPTSAGGTTGRAWPSIASDLRAHFGAFDCALTTRADEATEIAAREAKAGRSFIIACGGDGTISEVANGILSSGEDAELGVLPSGTGGDFRRTLKMPVRVKEAARALREGKTRSVDVGRVTFTRRGGETGVRHFLNVSSFGMGGAVLERLKTNSTNGFTGRIARAFGGKLSYAVATLQATLSYTNPTVRLQFDDGAEFRPTITVLCVSNGQFFGGGMKIAPGAKLNDGLLDIITVGDLSRLAIFANSYRLYLGKHLGMQQVSHAHARRLTARPVDESTVVAVEADGEIVGQLPATFEILPSALRIRSPK